MLKSTAFRDVVPVLAFLGVLSIIVHLIILYPIWNFIRCPVFNLERAEPEDPVFTGVARWMSDGEHVLVAVLQDATVPDNSTGPLGRVYVAATDGSGPLLEAETSSVVSISPDGSRVAFVRYTRDCHGFDGFVVRAKDIRVMNTDGSDVHKVMDLPIKLDGKKVSYAGGLTWSPNGRLLAAVGYQEREKNDDDRGEEELVLYTVKADGSDARRVGSFPGRYAGDLMWSPDGQPFGFGEPASHYRGSAAWSPDGQLLAFSSVDGDGDGRFVIYTVEADASRPARQPIRSQTVVGPLLSPLAWSPDGQSIAFVARDDGHVKLYTMGRDGSSLREVADAGVPTLWYGLESRSVAWSPNGSRVLFSLNPYNRDGTLYVASADGSGLHGVGGGSYGAWSPDGSRIASLEAYSSASLRTMAPDGSDVRVLARGEHGVLEAVGPGQWRSSADPAACDAGVAVPDPEGNPGLVRDCEALMELRDKLSGSTRLNWETNSSIFSWEGVMVDISALREESLSSKEAASRPRVRGLSLRARGLRGIIPPEVARLTALQVLDLSHNELAGPIPPELSELNNLTRLGLARSGLWGPIPPELGNLENMTTLNLEYNGLWGPIPPELGNLKNLTILNLGANALSGAIPPELGNLENLTILNLGANALSEAISPELGDLENLTTLRLEDNALSGAIPPELGNLKNLTTLRLEDNALSGAIPLELGDLENLTTLDLRDNDLNGTIPSELGDLAALRILDLSGNGRLSGCIPPELYGEVRGYRAPTCGQ